MSVGRAKIILDSIGPSGVRLTTFECEYWRSIHSEVMTHRVFSRNASSSRAIPVDRQLNRVRKDTAGPLYWGANQKGMQAGKEIATPVHLKTINRHSKTWVDKLAGKFGFARVIDRVLPPSEAWTVVAEEACYHAEEFKTAGYHKQVVNRILEPYNWIKVVITATEWDNFWALRCHPDAQPEFQQLANLMRSIYLSSTPKELKAGEWHTPYVLPSEQSLPVVDLLKVSSARCARTSYDNHEGRKPLLEEDIGLFHNLVGQDPKHASPVEHQAMAVSKTMLANDPSLYSMQGNFKGWIQHRKIIETGGPFQLPIIREVV